MGGSNGHAMVDNGDDTHSVTISIPEGTAGNYAFFNSPNNHYDWGTKENLEGQDCADTNNFNDRYLDAVTEAGSVSFCYGTCDTECAAPNNGIAEFPACFDFEGEAALDGWQIVPAEGTAADPTWQILTGPAVDDVNATDNGLLVHPFGPQDVPLRNFAISPQFNTSGMSDAQLSYDEWIQDGTFGTAHRVWVSTDEVLSFTSDNLTLLLDNIHGTNFEFNSVALDLPEADYVTVIFDYEGTYGSLWALDNMCV